MNTNLSRIARIAAAALAFAGLPAWSFIIGPQPDPDAVSVVEYLHDLGDGRAHYFLAADPGERQFIDAGGAGPGWRKTGHRFSAFRAGSNRASPVCRFYAPGPVSHFFTASVAECEALRTHDLGWNYEGIAFEIAVASAGGACARSQSPIYRLLSGPSQFPNDTNHRYVAGPVARDDLVAQGWIDEGAVFCTGSADYIASKSFDVAAGKIRSAADCENEDLGGGGCIALNGIAGGMVNRIGPYLPPFYVTNNPQWSNTFGYLTGYFFDLFTAQPPDDTQAVVAHSFVQRSGAGSGPNFDEYPVSHWGFRVSGVDRTSGSLGSIDPTFQFWTRAPVAGAADARVFPWRLAYENYIDLTFGLALATVRRGDSASHAYGAPLIEFRDTKSGAPIDVTVLAYASFPPGDFVGAKDPVTGAVYVSTTFGDQMTFGRRLNGNFVSCDTAITCTGQAQYLLRITKADFAHIIDMARASNPGLSTDVNDYLLVKTLFRNGIVNDADVGVQLWSMNLSVFGY